MDQKNMSKNRNHSTFLAFPDGISRMKSLNRASNKETMDCQVKQYCRLQKLEERSDKEYRTIDQPVLFRNKDSPCCLASSIRATSAKLPTPCPAWSHLQNSQKYA